MFQTNVVEKIKSRILFPITLSRKSCRLWDYVEKYCRPGPARLVGIWYNLLISNYMRNSRKCNNWTAFLSTATSPRFSNTHSIPLLAIYSTFIKVFFFPCNTCQVFTIYYQRLKNFEPSDSVLLRLFSWKLILFFLRTEIVFRI